MDSESNDFDDNTTASMWAHEQELEDWQDELTNDPGYFEWLSQIAASAVSRTEVKYGDHGERLGR